MKYYAIIMAPQLVEFESVGGKVQKTNKALALCNNFKVVGDYSPKLLLVHPIEEKAKPILVSDPPPMAA